MNDNMFLELLTKKISGQLSLTEQIQLNEMLRSNAYDEGIDRLIDELKDIPYEDSEMSDKQIIKHINSIHKKIVNNDVISQRGKTKKYIWLRYTSVAASLILLFSLTGLWIRDSIKSASSSNIVTTKKASKSDLVLPDGTKVWINSDSKLSYGNDFGSGTRDVFLEGEAYFDVKKDEHHPFVVHTKTMDIRVLGTAFNVRAYGDEKTMQTTLLRGAVEVFLKRKDNERIVLRPNEKIVVKNNYALNETDEKIIDKTIAEFAIHKVNPDKKDSTTVEIKWIKNELVFEDENINDLVLKLERWYDVKITLKKKINSSRKFNGTFNNDTIEEVLESLRLFEKFNYSIDKKEIIIF